MSFSKDVKKEILDNGFVSAENIGEAVKICLDKVKSTIKVEKTPVEVK